MRALTKVEEEIFELWKKLYPDSAFVEGLREYAGKLFIPSDENVRGSLAQIKALKKRAENEVQLKFLVSSEIFLKYVEPHRVAADSVGIFFAHMVKEGINTQHMLSLVLQTRTAMEAVNSRVKGSKWTLGAKVLTIIGCNGLMEILHVIKKETRSERLKKEITGLQKVVRGYLSAFEIPGMREANFDEVYPLFRRSKEDLGRSYFYADFIRDVFDYPERPHELERMGLKWLREELPLLLRLTEKLAKGYGVRSSPEAVSKVLAERSPIKRGEVVAFVKNLRKFVIRVVHKNLVRINPRYDTRVIQTPSYLAGLFPTAAAAAYNYLKGRPFQLFLVTTDPKKSPPTGIASILQLLIHEEYGHAVNFSNTAYGYGARPSLIEKLQSFHAGAVTEGISFQRELEFLEYFNGLINGRDLKKEERDLIGFLSRYVDPRQIALENEFVVRNGRVTRFLRVIGDVRINTGKQTLAEFIEWAHRKTGLSKSLIYYNVFPAHQSIAPGYATTYAVVGQSIRTLQRIAIRNGKRLVDFNTYASAMGFPPRTIFEERLRNYAVSG